MNFFLILSALAFQNVLSGPSIQADKCTPCGEKYTHDGPPCCNGYDHYGSVGLGKAVSFPYEDIDSTTLIIYIIKRCFRSIVLGC